MAKKGGEVEEGADERTAAEIGQAYRNDWEDTWKPFEQEFAADLQDTAPERRQAQGINAVESARAFGLAMPKGEAADTLAGARPGSSRFALGITDAGTNYGLSRGLGSVDVDNAIDDQYQQGLQALTQVGRGQQVSALRGINDIANMSSRQSQQDAINTADSNAAWQRAGGTALGLGASMYGGTGKSSFDTINQFGGAGPLTGGTEPASFSAGQTSLNAGLPSMNNPSQWSFGLPSAGGR